MVTPGSRSRPLAEVSKQRARWRKRRPTSPSRRRACCRLAKMIFIFNGCAALVSAVSCYFLPAMASSFTTFDELGR
jgi:hypothetical protein